MKKSLYISQGAFIAALYVVLTYITNLFGLANGVIQFRISEALAVLPCFTPAAVPGLFIGCLAANLITGGTFADIVAGSMATLIGAYGAHLLRSHKRLSPMPSILSNAFIVPLILLYSYKIPGSYLYFVTTVFVSEALSAGVLGEVVISLLKKYRVFH